MTTLDLEWVSAQLPSGGPAWTTLQTWCSELLRMLVSGTLNVKGARTGHNWLLGSGKSDADSPSTRPAVQFVKL